LQTALKLHQAGRFSEAVLAYRAVLAQAPRNFDALHLLGVALTQSGKAAEGLPLLKQALKLNPASTPCKLNLANALLETGDFAAASGLFRTLIAGGTATEATLRGMAQCFNELGQHADALILARQALDKFPKSAALLNELGRALASSGKARDAADAYRRALTLMPAFTAAACNLGNALTEIKAFDESEAVLTGVLAREPNNLQALTNLAHMFRTNWQAEQAIATAERALTVSPRDPGLRTFIGGCLIDLGRNDEAAALFREMIGAGQQLPEALAGLAQIHKFKAGDSEIDLAATLLANPKLTPKERKPLLFTRAKIEDDIGHPGEAVAAAIAAKQIDMHPMPIAEYGAYMADCRALMGKDLFAQLRPLGSDDQRPVFILGMPRSGTTLTEQIIASHGQADGAGELTAMLALGEELGFRTSPPEAFVARLKSLTGPDMQALAARYLAVLGKNKKPEALRITDKMPHNFEVIWLIALLFPGARIVHCNRNPVDVAISIFLRNFSAGHWYSQDLAVLGKYYNLYKAQVAHWREVCGLAWFESDYEALVGEPEPNIRALIDFLGLPWDDRCLQHTQTERSVHTFSKWQVRQPIYKSSVERWRKYAPYIQPLLHELGIGAGQD
jgi:tetratricopeptide (TPR) repeat protein